MIIRLMKAGKSFKALGRYLLTDPKAKTAERVAWTHTLNLASEMPGEAIHEMYWTYRAADQLKRENGIRPGSTPLKNPVKHLSLSWSREHPPSPEHMLQTVKAFLKRMGWDQHQALVVCHDDKHPHLHVMLNAVDPATGRALDTSHEWRRAQKFALDYEQAQGRIECKQRLLPESERQPAPTRQAWQKMTAAERQLEQDEAVRMTRAPDYFDRGDPAHWKAKEWEALRGYQKDQRTEFFAGGKRAYREVRNRVFREARTEMRDQWNTWYRLRREGCDLNLLGEIKKGILERQNEELEKRREAACKELREQRDTEYAGILQSQREERARLRQRQDEALRTYDLLDHGHEAVGRSADRPQEARDRQDRTKAAFGAAADETTKTRDTDEKSSGREEPREAFEVGPSQADGRVRHPLDVASLLSLGGLGAIAEVGERLFDGFFGGTPAPRPKPQSRHTRAPENDQARATERHQRATEAQAEETARLHAYWEERRRSRGRDRD